MLQVTQCIDICETTYNSSTLSYMKNNRLTTPPEDVYFTKNMIELRIGKVADYDTANKFSIESIYNSNPFGGHNFWYADNNWKKRLYNNVIIQVNPHLNILSFIDNISHRGGWKDIVNTLIISDFYDFTHKSCFNFIDILENYCISNFKFYDNTNPIISMIHGTIEKNPMLKFDWYQLNYLFNSSEYGVIKSNIAKVFTFSNYIRNFIIKNNFINPNDILSIIHPINLNINKKFNLDNYLGNKNKSIIQLGQQQRYVDTIYKIKATKYKKIWLPGCSYNYFRKIYISKDVEILYYDNYDDYDELLSMNIVLCHIIDANANNSVIECIIRNTPLIINRHPAIEEYLGIEYPLYFDNINDIDLLLNDDNLIINAHLYLSNINKSFLSIPNFTNKLFSEIYDFNHSNNINSLNQN